MISPLPSRYEIEMKIFHIFNPFERFVQFILPLEHNFAPHVFASMI